MEARDRDATDPTWRLRRPTDLARCTEPTASGGEKDGRRATTHRVHVEELASAHPRVEVDPQLLSIDAGQVLNPAGTAAAIDLMLYIVRRDHGAGIANLFAGHMLVPLHRDAGQAQFLPAPVAAGDDGGDLADVLTWMIDHLEDQLRVEELAARAATSTRTFARRFPELTGTSPGRWLRRQRVVRAHDLLECTDLTIDTIAPRVGFRNAANLRGHFSTYLHTTPPAYRRRFRPPRSGGLGALRAWTGPRLSRAGSEAGRHDESTNLPRRRGRRDRGSTTTRHNLERLRRWEACQAEERLSWPGDWPETGLVFTQPNGEGSSRRTARGVRHHGSQQHATRSTSPRSGPMGLLHTYTTAALRAGVSPEVVIERLGHGSVLVTSSIHAHMLEQVDQVAAGLTARAIFGR